MTEVDKPFSLIRRRRRPLWLSAPTPNDEADGLGRGHDAIDDPAPGLRALEKISTPMREGDRSYRGFNLFRGADLDLFRAIVRGEFTISGFQGRRLRAVLPDVSGPHLSRLLKRLRIHGLIKKIGRRYKYYLTTLGRTVTTAALKLRELGVPRPVLLLPARIQSEPVVCARHRGHAQDHLRQETPAPPPPAV